MGYWAPDLGISDSIQASSLNVLNYFQQVNSANILQAAYSMRLPNCCQLIQIIIIVIFNHKKFMLHKNSTVLLSVVSEIHTNIYTLILQLTFWPWSCVTVFWIAVIILLLDKLKASVDWETLHCLLCFSRLQFIARVGFIVTRFLNKTQNAGE